MVIVFYVLFEISCCRVANELHLCAFTPTVYHYCIRQTVAFNEPSRKFGLMWH